MFPDITHENTNLKEKNSSLRQQLKQAKKTRRCPKCNRRTYAYLWANTESCPACNFKPPESKESD